MSGKGGVALKEVNMVPVHVIIMLFITCLYVCTYILCMFLCLLYVASLWGYI